MVVEVVVVVVMVMVMVMTWSMRARVPVMRPSRMGSSSPTQAAIWRVVCRVVPSTMVGLSIYQTI